MTFHSMAYSVVLYVDDLVKAPQKRRDLMEVWENYVAKPMGNLIFNMAERGEPALPAAVFNRGLRAVETGLLAYHKYVVKPAVALVNIPVKEVTMARADVKSVLPTAATALCFAVGTGLSVPISAAVISLSMITAFSVQAMSSLVMFGGLSSLQKVISDNSPSIIAPAIGAAGFTALALTGAVSYLSAVTLFAVAVLAGGLAAAYDHIYCSKNRFEPELQGLNKVLYENLPWEVASAIKLTIPAVGIGAVALLAKSFFGP